MKTRFSPSPTGQMHLGNARTALFNVLLARHQNYRDNPDNLDNLNKNQFLLRIEDTDPVRSKTEYTELLLQDLHWLNLIDNPMIPQPVYQSERQKIYEKYYAVLIKNNQAYPCFCTEEQLALSRKIQLSQHKPPRYAGTCRDYTQENIDLKLSQGFKPALRFRVTPRQDIIFDDLVKGSQKFKSSDIGDFIIRRGDGSASFFFCNAIDDALMGVTHALRGEDHLTNTPRQILILNALNLPIPSYGHIALIMGSDGSPLSKRHGSKSLKELRASGFLPQAINNYLARLGHYYENNHFLNLDLLSQQFSLKNLSTSPAHYDESQLLHWQKLAVMNLTHPEIINWLEQNNINNINIILNNNNINTNLLFNFIQTNFLFPADIQDWINILFNPEIINNNNINNNIYNNNIYNIIIIIKNYININNNIIYKNLIHFIQEKLNITGKALFMPLRLILTGKEHGPDLNSIIELMGRENILKRLGD